MAVMGANPATTSPAGLLAAAEAAAARRLQRGVRHQAACRHRLHHPRRQRRAALCQPGAVRALDGLVRIRRLCLCLDLGAAARRPGRSRHRHRRAALHPGIPRAQASSRCCADSSPAAAGSCRDGDRVGGARGARRDCCRRHRLLRDHAALHRLRRPAALRARPHAGRHRALLRLDQSRADAALSSRSRC